MAFQVIDDLDSRLVFLPLTAWSTVVAPANISNQSATLHETTAVGSTVELMFQGTWISVSTLAQSSGANYTVTLNGQHAGTYDTSHSETSGVQLRLAFTRGGLDGSVNHTLVIKKVEDDTQWVGLAQGLASRLSLDAIYISNVDPSASSTSPPAASQSVGPPSSSSSPSHPLLPASAIGGLVVGVVGFIGLVFLSVVICRRRRSSRRRPPKAWDASKTALVADDSGHKPQPADSTITLDPLRPTPFLVDASATSLPQFPREKGGTTFLSLSTDNNPPWNQHQRRQNSVASIDSQEVGHADTSAVSGLETHLTTTNDTQSPVASVEPQSPPSPRLPPMVPLNQQLVLVEQAENGGARRLRRAVAGADVWSDEKSPISTTTAPRGLGGSSSRAIVPIDAGTIEAHDRNREGSDLQRELAELRARVRQLALLAGETDEGIEQPRSEYVDMEPPPEYVGRSE